MDGEWEGGEGVDAMDPPKIKGELDTRAGTSLPLAQSTA